MSDLPDLVARFAAALHAAGLPIGPERAARFSRAIIVAAPTTLPGLRACAHATLALGHDHDPVIDSVFDIVFAGITDPADRRGDSDDPPTDTRRAAPSTTIPPRHTPPPAEPPPPGASTASPRTGDDHREATREIASVGSDVQRLRHREFGGLAPEELAALADAMAALRLATPVRRSRRSRRSATGRDIDMRASLRIAHRSGGDPYRLIRRKRRPRPRRLVALCDISGSMEPYARAMLQLLYCAATGPHAEVFTFATQLTRLTPVLARSLPGPALASAGTTAPDWSGGTRIGAAVSAFLDRYGRRGMARGSVMLIISDGWETGDPAELGRAMERLSRLAYRIVWVNPRTQSPRYRPLVGGMAAAWPHCDAVVSAHRIDALDDLVAALADPVRTRARPYSTHLLEA
jgi:uncharacterized protein with von Willebrand factor type A (vWA) domain